VVREAAQTKRGRCMRSTIRVAIGLLCPVGKAGVELESAVLEERVSLWLLR
jgi:hypothetical protein